MTFDPLTTETGINPFSRSSEAIDPNGERNRGKLYREYLSGKRSDNHKKGYKEMLIFIEKLGMCPFCKEDDDEIKTAKFCPYCGKRIRV